MIWDEYKKLKKGDRVKFENVYVHDKRKISGEGRIYGFGEYDNEAIILIIRDDGYAEYDGEIVGVHYEHIKK